MPTVGVVIDGGTLIFNNKPWLLANAILQAINPGYKPVRMISVAPINITNSLKSGKINK